MKFISIRLKILVTCLILTTGCLAAFLFTARSLFEQDKMAYLFESNQRSAEEKAQFLNSQFQQWAQTLKSLSLYVDLANRNLGPAGENLAAQFREMDLLRVEEWGSDGFSTWIRESRLEDQRLDPFLMADLKKQIASSKPWPRISLKSPTHAFLHLKLESESLRGRALYLSVALKNDTVREIFQSGSETRYFLLDQNLDPAMSIPAGDASLWPEIRKDVQTAGPSDLSRLVKTPDEDYLVSFSRLADFDFAASALTPKSVIQRVLRDLSLRTFYVFALSFFVVLGLSVVFAKGITQNLEELLKAVQKIAKGDFNIAIRISSRDETAKLADGFRSMSTEISRLLDETAEKSRMEAELKTAQAVQSTLFPDEGAVFGDFEIMGFYQSASECGGDWWFYREQNGVLFVVIADATGHGAPAALITSAARSAWSLTGLQGETSAAQIAWNLNRAIFETSKASLLMTAFILKIDLRSGRGEMVNCSHEFPLIAGEGKAEFVVVDPDPRLGESADYEATSHPFQLERGQTFVLFTDGLTGLLSPQGKEYGERRFVKSLGSLENRRLRTDLGKITEGLETFRAGAELPDDVTLVLIRRSGLNSREADKA